MDEQGVADFLMKLTGDAAAAAGGLSVAIGDRLGLYPAMAGAGPLTAAALAQRTGLVERYIEEWLAVQAGLGYVEYDQAAQTFTLPEEHAAVLADERPARGELQSDRPVLPGGIARRVPALGHGPARSDGTGKPRWRASAALGRAVGGLQPLAAGRRNPGQRCVRGAPVAQGDLAVSAGGSPSQSRTNSLAERSHPLSEDAGSAPRAIAASVPAGTLRAIAWNASAGTCSSADEGRDNSGRAKARGR